MWLGLLFSILAVTMLSYTMLDSEPPEYKGVAGPLLTLYRLRTAQCLMIGDIARCLPYTLETLIYYASAEFARRDDNYRGQWMLASFMVRAAVNMGYHREPPKSSSVSVLQAELRRRVWYSIVSIDQKASFLLGFPTMVAAIPSDVHEPRNLFDWELSHDMSVLPYRELGEVTPVTHLIGKFRLISTLGHITDFNNFLTPGSYDDLLRLDQALIQAYKEQPPPDPSINPTASMITTFQVDRLYHQGICSLHRRYLPRGRIDHKYSISSERCISSALGLLAQQASLYEYTRAMSSDSMPYWYQARHPFILAAMILCLDLEQSRKRGDSTDSSDQQTMIQALSQCCDMWKVAQRFSDEAAREYKFLSTMLQKFESTQESDSGTSTFSHQPASFNSAEMPENVLLGAPYEMDIDWVRPQLFPVLISIDLAHYRRHGTPLSKLPISTM
jgi:hypothetical protein